MSQGNTVRTSIHDAKVQQEALEWQVMLWSGEVTVAEQQAFEEWLVVSDAHQKAWHEISTIHQRLQLIPDSTVALLNDKTHFAKRRRLLQLLSIAAVSTATIPVVRQSEGWQILASDYRTSTGQQKRVVLADGSQLTMNTSTAVDVKYSEHERRLILHEGEIYLSSAEYEMQDRPLLVQTRHGTAQALGTKFNVRLKPHETRVSVQEGRVKLRSENGLHSIVVPSGTQAGFSDNAVTNVITNGNESAWLEGKLIAEQMQLGTFLDDLSRYRSGVIRYDQKVANMLVSGVFPLLDTDRVLQSLLQALPLRIEYFSKYWVTVHAV
jgi:transmembrane sensor